MSESDAPCFARDDMGIGARKARTAESRPSKDGPKFQPGLRYPSGKLKPVDRRDKGFAPAVVKRVVEQAKRGATDPRLGSAVGVLHLNGVVDAVQFSAAARYAKVRGRYDRIMNAQRRHAPSPDYGTARSGSGSSEMSEADVANAKRQHADMLAAIDAGVTESWCVMDGRGGFMVVGPGAALASKAFRASRRVALLDRVLVDDLPAEWADLDVLRRALDGLAGFFRITA